MHLARLSPKTNEFLLRKTKICVMCPSAVRIERWGSYSVICCCSPHHLLFGFFGMAGLTRPSTRTRNYAIKAMIMLPKSEMTRKWR
jgi:hypothetical protein